MTPLLIFFALVAAMHVGAFCWMVHTHRRIMREMYETVRTIAVFKKAGDTQDLFDLRAVSETAEEREAREKREEGDKKKRATEAGNLPHELGDGAMVNVRSQMSSHRPSA